MVISVTTNVFHEQTRAYIYVLVLQFEISLRYALIIQRRMRMYTSSMSVANNYRFIYTSLQLKFVDASGCLI